jgi:hypothetical protein
MLYKENVAALALKLAISSDPELREEDIQVERLIFYHACGSSFDSNFVGTSKNRGARLFFQDLALEDGEKRDTIQIWLYHLELAAYFAELWDESAIERGERPLFALLKTYGRVRIVWKPPK